MFSALSGNAHFHLTDDPFVEKFPVPKEPLSRLHVFRREILRKLIHVSFGVVVFLAYLLREKNEILMGLLLCLLMTSFFEVLRRKGMLSVPFLREGEKNKIGGHIFFVMGVLLSVLLFDKSIALASIVMLALGDAAAGLAHLVKRKGVESDGALKGLIKPPEICIVMFAVSFLVGFPVVDSVKEVVAGALGATIADGVYLRIYGVAINDNLTIPLCSGFLMTIAS